MHPLVIREQIEKGLVGRVDVSRVPRERHPPEGSTPRAELGPDVGRHKPRECERVQEAVVVGPLADVVAVIESDRAALLEFHHDAHVPIHRRDGEFLVVLRVTRTQRGGFPGAQIDRDIPLERVVRARLVGEHVGDDPAFEQPLEQLHRVAMHADALGGSVRRFLLREIDRLVEAVDHMIEVLIPVPAFQPGVVHVGDQAGRPVQCRGERLSTAHAAAPGGHDQFP